MALTFPREMPLVGVGRQTFEIDRADYLSRDGAGRLGGMSAGFPLWKAQWTLADAIGPDRSDEWRGFITSLRGPQRLFFGYDVERPYPKAYINGFGGMTRAGGGAFDGSATSWSEQIWADGQSYLMLQGLPVGFLINVGDYIGFRWMTGDAPRRALVRATEFGYGTSEGQAQFAVEPAIPTVVPPTAVAYLNRPTCLMRLDPKQTSIGAMGRRRVVGAQITAIQDLLV